MMLPYIKVVPEIFPFRKFLYDLTDVLCIRDIWINRYLYVLQCALQVVPMKKRFSHISPSKCGMIESIIAFGLLRQKTNVTNKFWMRISCVVCVVNLSGITEASKHMCLASRDRELWRNSNGIHVLSIAVSYVVACKTSFYVLLFVRQTKMLWEFPY